VHAPFIERLGESSRKMQASAHSGRLKDEAVANRRLGRLFGQYWRAAGAFDVKIERLSPHREGSTDYGSPGSTIAVGVIGPRRRKAATCY
jgi:hypothetical protein